MTMDGRSFAWQYELPDDVESCGFKRDTIYGDTATKELLDAIHGYLKPP